MIRDDSKRAARGAWLAAMLLGGVSLTCATTASAQINVSVDVPAPEITVSDPEEVTAATEPPDPVYEERLDMPGPGYAWVGGSWGWTGSDWGWTPGRWLVAPEGRVYVEPYYERVGPNVVYVRGYWGPPGAPVRSYGGERIHFVAPPRPVDYRRGEPPRFERRPGAPPGSRPMGFYEHARGPVRPIPRATAPIYRPGGPGRVEPGHEPGRVEPGREPGRVEPGRVEPGRVEPGRVEPGHEVAGRDRATLQPGHAPPPHEASPREAAVARGGPPPHMAPPPHPGPSPTKHR
jgi:hypothetical protein